MKTNNLLTKEEVLSFNLWATYFNFLTSLKEVFERELETCLSLNGVKIYSFIESRFYEVDGRSKESGSANYPDAEEVHFQVKDKENFVSVTFDYGDTSKFCLDLYTITEENGEKDKELRYLHGFKIDQLFSFAVIEAAVCWIETGELSDFAKDVFESI